MTDYIKEMMKTAGVECLNFDCDDECPHFWDAVCNDGMCPTKYPSFTPEKQIYC